jgi:hypothetical protein
MDLKDTYDMLDYDPYQGMNDDERMRAGCLHCVGFAATVIAVLLLCALLGGCKTEERVVTIETVRRDTTYIIRHERDSIYMHDSIHVREKGDTVTIERWHTRWRDRWQYDTIYISKTDSVPRPYPVEVEVPAELTTWQRLRIGLGDAMLLGLAAMVIAAIVRWRK